MENKVNGYHTSEPQFQEIKIPVPWGHIAGKWWGPNDKQPVIAMHGWQDNAGTFDNLAPLLVKHGGISVLCIDLPGHGLSSHLPEGAMYYVFWDGLHFLRRIVKHFKWQRIQVMGHSLGGAIAFLYAAAYPDEVDCYIGIDIASPAVRQVKNLFNNLGDMVNKFLKYETLTPQQTPRYNYEEMVDIVQQAHGGSCTRGSCELLMIRGMVAQDDGTYMFARDPRLKVGGLAMMDIEHAVELGKHTTCRVMNIRATPGRVWENLEYYDRALDAVEQNAKVLERHLIEGTHHLHLNDAGKIYEKIVKFLKSAD